MTLNEAKETTVFVVKDNKVEEINLYDKMLQSLDETTTPRGVGSRLFVEDGVYTVDPEDYEDEFEMEDAFSFEVGTYKTNKEDFELLRNGTYELKYFFISSWGCTGNRYSSGDGFFDRMFLTQEEVDEKMFEFLKVDFDSDWDNSCGIFYNKEDALNNIIENLSYDWGCDEVVVKHIFRKQELVDKIRKQKLFKTQKIEADRVAALADIYSKMIDRVNGESYKDTIKRLSGAIGNKIESKVFHSAIKILRN